MTIDTKENELLTGEDDSSVCPCVVVVGYIVTNTF
jgi:hypothetical protein